MDNSGQLPDSVKFIGAVQDEWQLYSDNATDYTLGQPIGFGASSIVYQAEYRSPSGESTPCALKVVDLDSLPMNSLPLIRRETQLMSLSKHPNVLRVRGSWVDGHKLYIALRLMRSGSVAHVLQYGWPRGVEEEVAKCILKDALEGLNYLHINGFIHRDVKAANLLIDDDGTVLLGDLGVAVALHDDEFVSTRTTILSTSGSETGTPRRKTTRGKRKSFVGTPCWMAPEVIAQKHYDSKADLWSLGITALELAQGRAPRSREPPHKVLPKIVQDDPPTLGQEDSQFRYSKAFKEVIQSCLRKDPDERPTAAQLLQTPFFRNVKKKDFLARRLLNGLPPLVDRQERRHIPPTFSHSSMTTWDFTQMEQLSPSESVRLEESLKDGFCETSDEAGYIKNNVNNSGRRVAFVSRDREGSPESSQAKNLTADVSTVLTSPTSEPPSDEKPFRESQRLRALKFITAAPLETFGRIAGTSLSSSNAPELWKKLKSKK